MTKKKVLIISLVFITVVLLSFLATTLLLKEKPSLPSKATGPTCPANSGSCTWSSDDTASSFNVKIIDQTTGETVINKTTSDKRVDFTPVGGHSYKCTITPINACGNGPESTDTSTCQIITGTPPPTSTPTMTLTPSVTPEVSLTPTDTLTPTPTEENTPTPTDNPTGTPTNTPTPTETPIPTETPTGTPQPTLTPTSTGTPTSPPLATNTEAPEITEEIEVSQPAPTIPESGTPANWLLLAVPLAIIILGLIF